jgi:hypothetical protein
MQKRNPKQTPHKKKKTSVVVLADKQFKNQQTVPLTNTKNTLLTFE